MFSSLLLILGWSFPNFSPNKPVLWEVSAQSWKYFFSNLKNQYVNCCCRCISKYSFQFDLSTEVLQRNCASHLPSHAGQLDNQTTAELRKLPGLLVNSKNALQLPHTQITKRKFTFITVADKYFILTIMSTLSWTCLVTSFTYLSWVTLEKGMFDQCIPLSVIGFQYLLNF